MIVWRGWGILGILIVGAWLVAGFIALSTIADGRYPGSPDAFSMAMFFDPSLYWVVSVAAIGAAVSMWFWGRWINREDNHHTVFFIPVQFWGLIIGILGLGLGAMMASVPAGDTSQLTSRLTGSCETYVEDLTDTQCGCLGESYTQGLSAGMIFALDRVISSPSPSNADATVIDIFLAEEMDRFSAEEQQAFNATTEAMFQRCLAP